MRSFMEDSSLYRPALPYGGTLCDTTVAGRDRGEERRRGEIKGKEEGNRCGDKILEKGCRDKNKSEKTVMQNGWNRIG